jgi:putative ABC transport system permease protein
LEISDEAREKRNIIKSAVSRHPDVKFVSASANLPLLWSSKELAKPPEVDEQTALSVQKFGVDYDFLKVLNMPILKGRDFSKDFADKNNFIINETAAQRLQWENPLGKQLMVGEQSGTVIGVVKDFLFGDIGFGIPPAVFYLESENLDYMLIKYSSTDNFTSIRKIAKEQWSKVAPDLPFDFYTLDDHFFKYLNILDQMSILLNFIGFVAIFFSCLGLLGLTAFMVERRTKEIGIRKVLGASISNISWEVIKEFIILVAIANIIALSFGSFGWSKVIQTGLLYTTNMGINIYIFAIFISLFTATIAIASQTLKAIKTNPVDSLRNE